MKKIMIIFVLALIGVGGIILFMAEHNEYSSWDVSTEMPSDKMDNNTEEVFYTEGNENLNYNYITNISVLETYNMPLEFYEEVGDLCSNLLEPAGIVGEKIQVIEVTSKYDIVTIVFESDSGAQINLKYNLKTGEHNEFLDM